MQYILTDVHIEECIELSSVSDLQHFAHYVAFKAAIKHELLDRRRLRLACWCIAHVWGICERRVYRDSECVCPVSLLPVVQCLAAQWRQRQQAPRRDPHAVRRLRNFHVRLYIEQCCINLSLDSPPSTVSIHASISRGATFRPPVITMSLIRPIMYKQPSASSCPTSPVCSQPSCVCYSH